KGAEFAEPSISPALKHTCQEISDNQEDDGTGYREGAGNDQRAGLLPCCFRCRHHTGRVEFHWPYILGYRTDSAVIKPEQQHRQKTGRLGRGNVTIQPQFRSVALLLSARWRLHAGTAVLFQCLSTIACTLR